MSLKLECTWSGVGTWSRCDTWVYSINQINHWIKQKGYKIDAVNYCFRFAKHNGFKGSRTDVMILAYQNFKLFREFVNNELKPKLTQ